MLAFKHNAGDFGTPGMLAPDAETSGSPISLHTAIELKVPHVEPGGLGGALLEQWPSYATYVVSFLIIGISWVNHHAVMDRIRRVNRRLLFMNLVFLMVVAIIPFPTALLADYLQEGHDERLAAAVYSGTMALMGVSFGSLWTYAVLSNDLLLSERVDADRARRSLWMFAVGNPLYVLAIAASLISATLALAINALLAHDFATAHRRVDVPQAECVT